MYFQFDREKLPTQVDRWLHAIFRLDPSLDTVADVDAKYGRRVEEFYGASLGTGVHVRAAGAQFPCALLAQGCRHGRADQLGSLCDSIT